MLRPSIVALSLSIAVVLTGCTNSPYRRMYSPQRSYYTPVREQKAQTPDLLPPLTSPLPGGAPAAGTPPAPAQPAAPAPEAAPMPGL